MTITEHIAAVSWPGVQRRNVNSRPNAENEGLTAPVRNSMNTKTNGAGQAVPLDSLVGLLEKAQKLNEIVEGLRSVRWNNEGFRLKDTSEWCEFYVALKQAEREQANTNLSGAASASVRKTGSI